VELVIMRAVRHPRQPFPCQRGASLLFALLALGAMTLAALALVSSVDTGTLVIGNIGFKQDATASADHAASQAIAAITTLATTTGLDADVPGSGYYASSIPDLDVAGQHVDSPHAQIDWDGDGKCPSGNTGCLSTVLAQQPAGSQTTARYVVTRLCKLAAPLGSGNNCAAQALNVPPNDKGAPTYANPMNPSTALSPYYRVIVRVTGARGTTSITETIVRF